MTLTKEVPNFFRRIVAFALNYLYTAGYFGVLFLLAKITMIIDIKQGLP